MGRKITLQDWRHIAIAISKRHARERGAAKTDFEDGGGDDDAERYKAPDDLAASHTGQTAANYGITIDVLKRLTPESLEVFGQVSRRWHKFLGCTGQLPSGPLLKRKGLMPSMPPSSPPSKRARTVPLGRLAAESNNKSYQGQDQLLLRSLQVILRNDRAHYRDFPPGEIKSNPIRKWVV
ncbi:hypothetical protein B0T10DRAFT_568911 [Thelonectria olida]|uniref:Uncharacterized protein n=1 Tax=Thelonectria olida TaxID=1576542 RepID=A0A9P8VS29_9HYPO|nr:hypothetical protein B0T10DRAFT_568911 [Thelonectria olida]